MIEQAPLSPVRVALASKPPPFRWRWPFAAATLVCTLVGGSVVAMTPAMAQQGALDEIAAYLAEGPIEHFLLQPEALPDDPSEEFFLVFDVRAANEARHGGMLPSARHVPYTDIASLLEVLGTDRSQPALIYCHTALRSTQVVMALKLLGYENVWYLAGGIERWRAAGKPLENTDPGTKTNP